MLLHVASAQTKLVSHHLDLQKSESYHRAIATFNFETEDVFLFAADKEKITIQQYNSAFFFKDSLTADCPSKEYGNISGYSFADDVPYIYWSSDDFVKIQAVKYDLKKKSTSITSFDLPFKREQILMQFNQNNTFYLISKIRSENKLKFYLFQGSILHEKVLDFSKIQFIDHASNLLTFDELTSLYPIRKMEETTGNSLVEATYPTKMYVQSHKIILSFDHKSTQTQILEIDLESFEISEKFFPQPQLGQVGKSNSFINNGIIFQCKANGDELVFETKSYETSKTLSINQFSSNEIVSFVNSPLLSQTGSKEPKIFKNTQKFLDRLNDSDIAISAYQLPNNNYLISIGGTRNVTSATTIILGATVLAAEVMVGSGIGNSFFDPDRLQVAFFDSLFDDNFRHITQEPEPLAIDFISDYMSRNQKLTLTSTFKFRDFYVFGYYDAKENQYVMRKFEDGFAESNTPFLKERPAIETGF